MGWWGMDGRQAPPGPPGLTIVSSPRTPPQNLPAGHSGGELGQEGHY